MKPEFHAGAKRVFDNLQLVVFCSNKEAADTLDESMVDKAFSNHCFSYLTEDQAQARVLFMAAKAVHDGDSDLCIKYVVMGEGITAVMKTATLRKFLAWTEKL